MKRIINIKIVNSATITTTIWRGLEYRVDGILADVDPPLHLLTETSRPAPDFDPATHKLIPIPAFADLDSGEWVLRSYESVALTPEEIVENAAIDARKVWPTVAEFWAEFESSEKYAIETSTDPEVIVLRADLKLWLRDVWSDDPRIVYALNKLVTLNILTEERRVQIITKD